MQKLMYSTLLMAGLCVLFTNCTKKDAQNAVNTMSATIGSVDFKASGGGVVAQTDPSPSLPGKTELTITASMGNQLLTIAIPDYDETNALHSYSFDNSEAIGGYNEGSGGADDIILSGTINITVSGGVISGTFDGTTNQNVLITNGTFT